nr:mitochondrial adenine nucleotide transporter ADNT1-like [Ipomoea batatas]
MTEDVRAFNLSETGCSASLISINLVENMFRFHRNMFAIVVTSGNPWSHSVTTGNRHLPDHPRMKRRADGEAEEPAPAGSSPVNTNRWSFVSGRAAVSQGSGYGDRERKRGILWFYRKQTGNEEAELTPILRLGAGACAGIIAMSATYPMDMVRGRLTVQSDKSPTQYRGIFHALRTVFVEEGPRALYRGWVPSVIGVIPYVGLNFSVYESLKDWLVKTRPFGLVQDSELSVTTKLACGAAAGTVGQTVAYPLDVVRRRMQMVGWKGAASVVTGDGKSKAPPQYTGMVDAFRKTVRHEGFGALYKGLVPNSVKVVPSIAIAFVTYEVVKDILGVEMRISD